ncbi:hypothetical protein BGW39_002613 [Mortierella sp. 14UC]|nr:hypothetical protein BGW39_002613 [Mortierella sp. 14UC]
MVRPDPCEDCEDERRRRLVRAKETAGKITSSGTATKLPFRIRHQAEQIDQVELWPRRQPGPGAASTETTAEVMFHGPGRPASAVPVGADLGRVATFSGLSSSDRQKVCGFHMHALEWHHMQTVGVDAILTLAKQTECEEFNFSVVRWLGDKVRTNVTNNNDTISPSSATAPTNAFGIRTNTNSSSIDLRLKLYANINCECGSDTVIAKGPTRPSPYRAPSKERQFLIVCRKKALLDPSLEIIESSLKDTHSGYHDHDYRVNRSRPKANPTGKVGKCISSISIDTAVFWCHNWPIHQHVETNKWLSQWLSPPQVSQPVPVSSRSRSTRPSTSSSLRSISTSNTAAPEPTPLIPHLSTAQDFRRLGQLQSSSTIASPSSPLSLTRRGPTQEQGRQIANNMTNAVAGLEDLDRELEETVAWHVAEVTSIMDTHDWLPSSASMSTPDFLTPIAAEREYANYQEINIENMYPSISMHLCQQCKEYARDFCVVPLPAKKPSDSSTAFTGTSTAHTKTTTSATSEWLLPLSPPQSSQVHLLDAPITHLTNWTPDTMVDKELEALDRELEMVDRELEWVMERHAKAVLEAWEARSRLVPGLLLCRGCDYRATGRDVLPCSHTLLCIGCVDQLEFYLVPRASSFWEPQ